MKVYMRPKLLNPQAALALAFAAIAAMLVFLPADRAAFALPPAGSDTFSAVGSATVDSRGGRETIQLAGTITIARSAPFMDGGVEVVSAQITSMSLTGTSLIGNVTITHNPSIASVGEIRSLQAGQEYPASAFFDVFAQINAPGPNDVQNNIPIRMTATANITEWPMPQLTLTSTALEGVDQDADTVADEDSTDDDGDHLFDEDGFAAGNQDTDAFINEDPTAAECVSQPSVICDDDGDGEIDEDPWCTPMNPTMPTGSCTVSVSLALHSDTDRDGCTDTEEMGLNNMLGGQRNRLLFWDFFDTPNGAALARDKVITIGDITAVVARFGASGSPALDPLTTPAPAPAYHTAFDRTDDPGSTDRWKLLGPNGSLTIADVVLEVSQFGTTCAPNP